MSPIDPPTEPGSPEDRLGDPTNTVGAEGDPCSPPSWPGDPSDYCIRLSDQPGTRCAVCQKPTGSGPIGYFKGDPICDGCLYKGSRDLGGVLALVATVRVHAFLVRQRPDQRAGELELLSSFIEAFERSARRWGPARVIEMRESDAQKPS